jgi:hypothetical protein
MVSVFGRIGQFFELACFKFHNVIEEVEEEEEEVIYQN